MKKKRILIVDDEAETRKTLMLIMQWHGYEAIAVENGKEALARITSSEENPPFDLLICDIQMPGMTGEELVDHLYTNSIEIPFLIITGYGEKDLVVRMMRKGCRDFIDKPFEPAQIEERVEMMFERDKKDALERERLETMAKVGLRTKQVVHDIRNMLGGAMGFTDLALEIVPKDERIHGYLTHIMNATTQAEVICQSLLNATKCSSQELVSTEMNTLVQRAGELIKNIIDQKVKIVVKTDNSPKWCKVNAERLQQALLNLAINAVQAMPDGGILSIVCTTFDDSNISIVISDTGMGMTEDMLEKIFEDGFTTKQDGNGIGLVTVKEIVNEHKGTIDVNSELGKGTEFVLKFPV